MKKILFAFLALALTSTASAQWTVTNVGTTSDLYSVHYFSATHIYIGLNDNTIVTSNGGATWTVNPLNSTMGPLIIGSSIQDLLFTSTTSGFAAGTISLGNTETVLNTTNSGVNWDFSFTNTTAPLVRCMLAVDRNSTRMMAVGNTGRIYRSVNTGASWSLISSGTTVLLNDVKFLSFDTVYACGNGRILRSFNAGTSWANVSIAQNFEELACRNHTVYAISDFGTTMRKSTNNGVSFTAVNLPFTSRSALHAISKDTVLVAGSDGIYITRNGGTYWEKYLLGSYQPVDKFDFLNSHTGIAVGESGYVIQTSNLNACPTVPISLFTFSGGITSVCNNDSVIVLNGTPSTAGYTYQWLLDGAPFSTTYNSGKKVSGYGTHVFSLITSNAWGSDTVSQNITVTGSGIGPMNLTAIDSACSGNIVALHIPLSESGVTYQLKKGSTNIGASKTGTGGPLVFSSLTGITTTTTFRIKASKYNPCFVDTLSEYKTIVVVAGTGLPTAICTPPNSTCGYTGDVPGIVNFSLPGINHTTDASVNNYTNYTCCKNATVVLGSTVPISVSISYSWGENVKVWIDYNGNHTFDAAELVLTGFANPVLTGNITIPAAVVLNQKLRMRVASAVSLSDISSPCDDVVCGEIEDYSLTVVPAPVPPVPAFTYTTTITCSTNGTFTNTSTNALSYVWDFGDGSPTSTAVNPTHSYTADGTYAVSLTATNPYGSTTFIQNITVTNPQVPGATTCLPTLLTCSSSIPKMTYLTIDGSYGTLSAFVQDYTCTRQFHLVSDSSYYFHITGNGEDNYYMALIDKNNDGIFTLGESLYPGGANMMGVGKSGSGMPASTAVTMFTPADVHDSIPLRMRLIMSTSFIGSTTVCGSTLCGDYKDFTVFITARPLDAVFTGSPLNSCSATGPVTVYFNNNSRSDVSWLWDFGDGLTSTAESPSHVYSSTGSYTVKLKVWDMDGNVDSLEMPNYVNISGPLVPPVITASGNVLSTAGTALSYQWSLNGTPITGATASSYTAVSDGNYTVMISNGGTCTATSAVYTYNYVLAGFSADTTTYCGVSTASVSFINTSTSATGYTWDFGDGSPLSAVATPIHVYNLPGTYTVTLIACDITCDTLVLTNFITIDATPFYAGITMAGPVFMCNGDSTILAGNTLPGASYQWYTSGSPVPGATNDTLITSSAGHYMFVISNPLGCIRFSDTVSINVDTACVWPGDADNSFAVDHYDLLPIGLFYAQTGPARSSTSNTWDAFPAINWAIAQPSGSDLKHADCNGDGTIDNNDTLAIDLNFTSTHLMPVYAGGNERSLDPDLYCVSSSATYEAGEWVEIDIMAGTTAEPINNLYGIGFTLVYDHTVVEPGTESMLFGNSWLTDLGTDGISFQRIDAGMSLVKASVTRISHTSKSGNGKLATFRFKVKNTIALSTVVDFNIAGYQANDEQGDQLSFDAGIPYEVTFEAGTSGIGENHINNNLQVYPNPFKNELSFEYSLTGESHVKIEILNALGENVHTVVNAKQPAGKHRLQPGSKWTQGEGLYLVKFTVNGVTTTHSLIHLK